MVAAIEARFDAAKCIVVPARAGIEVNALGPDSDRDRRTRIEPLVSACAEAMLASRRLGHQLVVLRNDGSLDKIGLTEKIRHESTVRLFVQRVRRAHLLDAALIHDRDAVGHSERLVLIMGDVDHRYAELALKRLDLAAHRTPQLG